MSRYAIILVLLVVVSASPASAVDTLQVSSPDPVKEMWRWTVFDRSSGLAGGVRDVFQDRDGHIWFATDRGAQRYDGRNWTTYTAEDGLAHNRVRTIIQTRDGAIWFGTNGGGISRFDGKTPDQSPGQAWTTYTVEDSLAANRMNWRGLLQARDGTIWAGFWSQGDATGTQGGISRFDGRSWSIVEVPGDTPRPNVQDIHESRDGSLWFSTWGQGVFRFDGRSWTRYTAGDGLAGDQVFEILESRDGSLWFACWRDGISRFDGRQWRTYTARDGLPEGVRFISIWQTEDGAVWAGGTGGKICRFDEERWTVYAADELPRLVSTHFGRPA